MIENVFQHFRREEHAFIYWVEELMGKVDAQYTPTLTKFLDPREQFIFESIVRGESSLSYKFYGGYEGAERKRALLYPDYFTPADEEFELSIVQIQYPVKFATLSHRQLLGSLMSVGVKREAFGDIITDGIQWQLFLANETKNYTMSQFNKVGKVNIRLKEIPYTQVLQPKDEWTEENATVSSLRIDTIISTIYNLSRTKAKQLVEANKVKLNWKEEQRTDTPIELLDVISVRGYGRIQLRKIEGRTKKDKIRIAYGVLRK